MKKYSRAFPNRPPKMRRVSGRLQKVVCLSLRASSLGPSGGGAARVMTSFNTKVISPNQHFEMTFSMHLAHLNILILHTCRYLHRISFEIKLS